jgi:hypothetical protein
MRGTVVVALAALAACGKSSTSATSPALPSIAGTYRVMFVPTDSNALTPVADTLARLGGQITIGPVAPDGSFTGSYYLAYITGSLAGTEGKKGTITMTVFGTAGAAPLQAEPYLEQVLPTCAWATATGGPMTGIVTSDSAGSVLTARGSVTVQCPSPADTGQSISNTVVMSANSLVAKP